MKIKHFPYRLGLIIPSSLILVNGITAWYSVLRFDPDQQRNLFLVAYAFVCVTYFIAVKASPGYTDGTVIPGAKYVQCLKCNLPKPERAHHCKTCGRCVLRMDHHCPWTENCVGFRNLGHFLRFLSSAALLTGYGLYRTGGFLVYAVQNRRYLHLVIPDTKRCWLALFSVISNFLVCLTLSLLWLRVFMDTANGQTQIENWEQERAYMLARRKMAPRRVFPFDIDYISNLISAIGPVYEWPLLWGGPSGSGHVFDKVVEEEERWPPVESKEVETHDYYRKDRWISIDGEQLGDFGVDFASELNDDILNHNAANHEANHKGPNEARITDKPTDKLDEDDIPLDTLMSARRNN